MSPQKYEQDIISVNENIEYYKNEIEYHKKFSLIVPALGILLAIAGLVMTATLYNTVLTRGSDIQDKIKNKNLEIEEIAKKREKLLGESFFYTKDFYNGENYNQFKEKVKEQQKKFERENKNPLYNVSDLYYFEKSAKERFLNRDLKIKVDSPFIKKDYDENENKIAEIENELKEHENIPVKDRRDNHYEEANNYREKIRIRKEMRSLFENLQYRIQRQKLDFNKEKDLLNVEISIRKIYNFFYGSEMYYMKERTQNKENSENNNRLELLLLEEQKSKKEKEMTQLENILAEKEKEQIQQSEIILISSQLLYRLGFLLVIELIAFYLIKQYRLSLDESRYYNTLLRENENNLFLLHLIKNESNATLKEKIYGNLILNSNRNKLISGESTEFLESRKISNDEMNVINKTLDMVGKIFRRKE